MSETFDGTDYSWLAVDALDRVGWFTLNGAGPVPTPLVGEDLSRLREHEAALSAFVRSRGKRFKFGAGNSMWFDAAAVGVFAFDFDDGAQQYRAVAEPEAVVVLAQRRRPSETF